MKQHRVKPGVSEHYLPDRTHRRIALEYYPKVFFDLLPHKRLPALSTRLSVRTARNRNRGTTEAGTGESENRGIGESTEPEPGTFPSPFHRFSGSLFVGSLRLRCSVSSCAWFSI